MNHKFFYIPVSDPVNAEAELNAFIIQHRIARIDRHFVADGASSFWAICVTWLNTEGTLLDNTAKRKTKVDYKDVLSAADFTVYAQLRELRKSLAEREGTPVYNIFTNEQLAALVQQRIVTKTALQAIDGIGQTRADKYGNAFLDCIKDHLQRLNANETPVDNP